MTRRRRTALSLLTLFAALASCAADATPIEVHSVVNNVAVTIGQTSLTVGQNAQAEAVTTNSAGAVLSGVMLEWRSSNSAVASVTPAGFVTAIAPGTATITATAEGVSGSATLTVRANSAPVATQLALTKQPNGVVSGQSFATPPVVEVRDATGALMSGATNVVTASIASGSGSITNGGQVVATNGVATFSNLRISGSGTFSLTFSASGLTSATSSVFTIAAQLATTLSTAAITGTINAPVSAVAPVSASGGTPPYVYTLSGGTLPAGMTFSTSTGQLSGTPTTSLSSTTFTVTVTDGTAATSSKNFSLTVNGASTASECSAPGAGWIFCDDFETNRLSSYYEYDNAGGKFVRATSAGRSGSTGMRATYTAGQAGAGALHLAFGRTPSSYFRPADAGTANYREIYWRFYVKREAGWVGNGPDKLTRAMIFAGSNFSQAMIAHGWTSSADRRYLLLDPVSGTNTAGTLVTTGYNDFANHRYLGSVTSASPEEDQAHVGQWACYEFHVKLNDPGQSNGVFDFKVNGTTSAQKTGLNWIGSYNAYGINAVFLEQYQNAGAPAANVRVLDNFVVSTQPIGCSAP